MSSEGTVAGRAKRLNIPAAFESVGDNRSPGCQASNHYSVVHYERFARHTGGERQAK